MAPDVLFVDDDEDLRAAMNEIVALLGHKCVVAGSLDQVIAHREEALSASVALIDLNLGPGAPSGLDVYRWLRRQGFAGEIAFLTGHGKGHPLLDEVLRFGDAAVLEKPIELDVLRPLLPNRPAS